MLFTALLADCGAQVCRFSTVHYTSVSVQEACCENGKSPNRERQGHPAWSFSFIPLRDVADCIFNIIAVVLWDNASSNLPWKQGTHDKNKTSLDLSNCGGTVILRCFFFFFFFFWMWPAVTNTIFICSNQQWTFKDFITANLSDKITTHRS